MIPVEAREEEHKNITFITVSISIYMYQSMNLLLLTPEPIVLKSCPLSLCCTPTSPIEVAMNTFVLEGQGTG